ncbi:MAG: Gfo/Idh/MocA family oxidoreductase [Planctomycetota bacterium]
MNFPDAARPFDRRRFLQTSAAAAGAIAFGATARPARAAATGASLDALLRSEKMSIGMIGCGGISRANMSAARDYLNVVAVCDVDAARAREASKQFAKGKAPVHNDYRAILDDPKIDLVHVATPDHWHAKPTIEAMLAGKDVYCEKPLTLTVDEGKLIRRVQQETGRVVQVGTQQRSTGPLFVQAVALVAAGRLGRIRKIQCAIGGAPSSASIPVAEVPAEFDWDRWLGPAPFADYRFLAAPEPKGNQKKAGRPKTNGHYEFRWWYEYSGGKLTDWGAHHVDIAGWALEANGLSPDIASIDGTAEHPVSFVDGVAQQKDRYNTATNFLFTAKTVDGVEIVIRNDTDNGVLIEGDKGRIFVNRKRLVGAPVEALKDDPLLPEAISSVYRDMPLLTHPAEKGKGRGPSDRTGHWANFLYSVRERALPISDVHSHMRALNICHLAGISARLGREINWDAKTERIVGDDVADSMLSRPYRSGYEIEMG